MTDGAHPPILPTEWHHDLAHVPPNIDLFIRLIVLTWRFSGRMMTGLRTDILKLLIATLVSSEATLYTNYEFTTECLVILNAGR